MLYRCNVQIRRYDLRFGRITKRRFVEYRRQMFLDHSNLTTEYHRSARWYPPWNDSRKIIAEATPNGRSCVSSADLCSSARQVGIGENGGSAPKIPPLESGKSKSPIVKRQGLADCFNIGRNLRAGLFCSGRQWSIHCGSVAIG